MGVVFLSVNITIAPCILKPFFHGHKIVFFMHYENRSAFMNSNLGPHLNRECERVSNRRRRVTKWNETDLSFRKDSCFSVLNLPRPGRTDPPISLLKKKKKYGSKNSWPHNNRNNNFVPWPHIHIYWFLIYAKAYKTL